MLEYVYPGSELEDVSRAEQDMLSRYLSGSSDAADANVPASRRYPIPNELRLPLRFYCIRESFAVFPKKRGRSGSARSARNLLSAAPSGSICLDGADAASLVKNFIIIYDARGRVISNRENSTSLSSKPFKYLACVFRPCSIMLVDPESFPLFALPKVGYELEGGLQPPHETYRLDIYIVFGEEKIPPAMDREASPIHALKSSNLSMILAS